MTFDQILTERHGAVMLVTLNRPEYLNAWTWQMSRELTEVFTESDADDTIRAVVVTGAGRAFCAGADLSGGGGTFAGESEIVGRPPRGPEERRLLNGPISLNTPVIAAINGPAVGAGLTLTMEWDLRVAAKDAKLGFVFNRRGMIPDAELLWLIPRMIGVGPAMDLLLTGRMFSGEEALTLGLVNRAVPAEKVLGCAMDLANEIAVNTAPASAAITKRLMYEFLTVSDRVAAWDRQRQLFRWAGRQPDAREGITAFLEHRAPQWSVPKRHTDVAMIETLADFGETASES
jgi:enoyl-CoA hydratase/carnithine racemase